MSEQQCLLPEDRDVFNCQRNRTIDRYIDSENALLCYIDDLHKRQVAVVALDLEGDQGTIRYNYSVSIYQCFDGTEMVIIDVLKMGNNTTLRAFLNDQSITKLMFSCANDIFITQNVLDCTISPVRDISVGQKLLNEPPSLSGYLQIDPKQKDLFQRANWLRRPIAQNLLEYATNDVINLFAIENDIMTRLRAANLVEQYCAETMKVVDRNYRINQMHHYKAKFPGYPRLSPSRKRAAAITWIIRELIGKHFDCPVGYILSKKAMSFIVRTPDVLLQSLERELNMNRAQQKRLKFEFIESLFKKAVQIAEAGE